MAVSAHRKHLLPLVIRSIDRQTLLPRRMLIYYSKEAWHLDPGWKQPPRITSRLPVELYPVSNMGSCRKYLFTLQQYRRCGTPVLLIDDDIVWRDDVFATLAGAFAELGGLVTTRGWSEFRIVRNHQGDEIIDNVAVAAHEIDAPVEVNIANSGWCTLLSPTSVLDGLFDNKLHDKYGVRYSDEVFLSAMCAARKFVVPIVGRFYERLDSDLHQWQNAISSNAKLSQLKLVKPVTQSQGKAQ
jgi:hypothetical protein